MPATARSSRERERCEFPGPPTSPKRRLSSTAIGRAPTAKMSRRIPPTPVAAPWNGSTALGGLCDSTLNAHTSPSPTSTAPAFSPGPMTTLGPSVGRVRNSFLECLYAQCSLHSSEYIASSTWFGVRPCFSRISSYSARVSPSASASSTVGSVAVSDTRACLPAVCPLGMSLAVRPGGCARSGALNRHPHRGENAQPVSRARQLVHGVLGMGHQAEHVAVLVAHARDVAQRAVEVLARRVPQHDLTALLHARKRRRVRVVATPRVLGGNAQARGGLLAT